MAPTQGVLANSDFPLYAIQALGNTHFLVAGGGGQAKTGVPNAIVCCLIKKYLLMMLRYTTSGCILSSTSKKEPCALSSMQTLLSKLYRKLLSIVHSTELQIKHHSLIYFTKFCLCDRVSFCAQCFA